jgi:hypothetical protein
MGTPVLQFEHKQSDPRWINMSILLVTLGGAIWGLSRSVGDNRWLWGTAMLAIGLALVVEVVRTGLQPERSTEDIYIYGSGRPCAFVFDEDEAIRGLTLAETIIKYPKQFIEQFTDTDTKKIQGYSIRPTEAPPADNLKDLSESGAFLLLVKLYHTICARQTTPVYIEHGHTISAPQTTPVYSEHGDPLQNRIAEKIGSLLSAIPVPPLQFVLLATLFVCAFLPVTFLLVGNMIKTLYKKVLRGFLLLRVYFVYIIARRSLPLLFADAIFGIDTGRFVHVSELPPGVQAAVAMSPELTAAATAVSARLGGGSGQTILNAAVGKDPFSIKTYINTALSDATLTHSYYYRAPEVLESIAKRIGVAD